MKYDTHCYKMCNVSPNRNYTIDSTVEYSIAEAHTTHLYTMRIMG